MRFDKGANKAGRVILVMALAAPLGALGDDLEQRVERLERQVQQLLELLQQRQIQAPAELEVSPQPDHRTAAQPNDEPVKGPDAGQVESARRGARIAYYIGAHGLDAGVPDTIQPLVAGEIAFNGELSFDPASYDAADSRLFSEYHDPSRYTDVGILLEGAVHAEKAGRYEFVVYPKPAREGGSAVSTTMAVQMAVDGRLIASSQPDTSWKPIRATVELSAGKHGLRLWAVSKSPGMGPSPTASRLKLAVKGPGDANPRTLDHLYPVSDKAP